jgi:hypothetical protein
MSLYVNIQDEYVLSDHILLYNIKLAKIVIFKLNFIQ